jgi:hypothetical protein
MRGADALWERDLFPILRACAARRAGDAGAVAGVALDVVQLVQARLQPQGAGRSRTPSPALELMLGKWREAFADALAVVESRCPQDVTAKAVTVTSDYIGAYLDVRSLAGPLKVWVFLTTEDGRYNRPGQAAAACVCLWEPGPVQNEALHAGLRGPFASPGARNPDRAAETAARAYRPLTSFSDEALAMELADWVHMVLVDSGLLSHAGDGEAASTERFRRGGRDQVRNLAGG